MIGQSSTDSSSSLLLRLSAAEGSGIRETKSSLYQRDDTPGRPSSGSLRLLAEARSLEITPRPCRLNYQGFISSSFTAS